METIETKQVRRLGSCRRALALRGLGRALCTLDPVSLGINKEREPMLSNTHCLVRF